MRYQNYEQIKPLDSNLLDELLTAGDAQERVWAAWEIGLRLGKKALPRISLQAHAAPDPGTRRHMVVVVAGLGHYSVLTTLAFHDPDESVRGTATQYLIRITNECDTAKINLIIRLLEEDRSPIVKQAILVNWDYKKQQIPIGLLFDCAGNKSENVRQAAIKQIVRQYSASGLSAGQIISCLSNQITKESICLFSNWLLKWELQDFIVVSAERALPSSSLLMLDFLADKDLKFSWQSLKKLCERKNPDTDIRILNILLIKEDNDLI